MWGDVSPLRLLQVPHLPARLALDLDGGEGPLLPPRSPLPIDDAIAGLVMDNSDDIPSSD